jgi:cytosine/adenosine deaminase-related metal-dependent hydrolase
MQTECESSGERELDVQWLLNPNQEPLRDVRLTFRDRVLTDIRPLPAGRQPEPLAVVPPLVNAHTHLEFSLVSRPLPAGKAFPDWIRQVIQLRSSDGYDAGGGVRRGLQESRLAGVSGVGEITTTNTFSDPADRDGIHVRAFREFIGLQAEAVDAATSAAREFLALAQIDTGNPPLLPGLSPHAPYSVHPSLFEIIARTVAAETGSADNAPCGIRS